jgi:cytochrome P450
MGRNERIWKDALKYDPTRFLGEQKYSAFQFPAFNAGPRICLGKSLVELQGCLVLASIVKNFTFVN